MAKNYLKEIDQFIFKVSSIPESRWFWNSSKQEVYLRRTKKWINKDPLDFIVIANIQTRENDQKKGYFSRFLDHLETLDVNRYVENVFNPDLAKFLLKRGFVLENRMDVLDCYYKLKPVL